MDEARRGPFSPGTPLKYSRSRGRNPSLGVSDALTCCDCGYRIDESEWVQVDADAFHTTCYLPPAAVQRFRRVTGRQERRDLDDSADPRQGSPA